MIVALAVTLIIERSSNNQLVTTHSDDHGPQLSQCFVTSFSTTSQRGLAEAEGDSMFPDLTS